MKTWIFAVVGLIIFIVLSLMNQWSLEKNSHQLAFLSNPVKRAIQQENWRDAARGLRATGEQWQKIKPVWSLLIRHQEIDAIDQALVRTQYAIRSRDGVMALIEYGSLTKLIEHIPKREEFSLVNIL